MSSRPNFGAAAASAALSVALLALVAGVPGMPNLRPAPPVVEPSAQTTSRAQSSAAPSTPAAKRTRTPRQIERDAAEALDGQLRASQREVLHPGGALEIVGVEQGDNEFRSSTPLLASATRSVTYVDPDELYERRLAMYEEGRSYSAPLAPRTPPGELTEAPDVPTPSPAPAPTPESSGGAVWLLLGLFALVAAGFAVRFVRREPRG